MVQPSSIDVRLDRYFRVFENHRYPHIDPAVEQPDLTRLVEPEEDEPFILHPGEFVLACTYEVITLPDDIAARLEGKSSLGRLGLLTHSTAGFIDPGFSGHVTLELSNVATLPIKLWPGMKIGQLCMFRLSSPAEHPYGSREVRLPLPGAARADAEPFLPELPPDADLKQAASSECPGPTGRTESSGCPGIPEAGSPQDGGSQDGAAPGRAAPGRAGLPQGERDPRSGGSPRAGGINGR